MTEIAEFTNLQASNPLKSQNPSGAIAQNQGLNCRSSVAEVAALLKDGDVIAIAVLRRRALDVVRRDTSKTSLSLKLKRAGWDEGFLRKRLTNISTT